MKTTKTEMRGTKRSSVLQTRRRGAVVAQVAIALTFLMGIAALVVDMGMIYSTRAELQRTADSAAIAAANRLTDWSHGSALDAARRAAQEAANANKVLGSALELEETDVVFGRAALNDNTGKYSFTETQQFPNSVRVRVRRTSDSKNGGVPTFFANIFGIQQVSIGARAAAVLTPRDIAFVMDLSSSHNDDSQLRAYKLTQINNRPVWEHLKDWDAALTPRTDSMGFKSKVKVVSNADGTSTVTVDLTSDGSSSTKALSHITFGLPAGAQALAQSTATSGENYAVSTGTDPTTGISGLKFDGTTLGESGQVQTESFSFTMQDQYLESTMMTVATKAGTGVDKSVQYNLAPGPLLGNMKTWGTSVTGPGWDFAGDAGLLRLAKGSAWSLSSSTVSDNLQTRGLGTYTAAEMSVINSSSADSNTASYRRRVRVALGLDRWKSGKSGGQAGGDGDNVMEANEIESLVPYPSSATNAVTGSKKVGGSWDAFIDYVINSGSTMATYDPSNYYYGDAGLRYRFGLKTWIDYLQEMQEGTAASPGLNGAPTQPMGAVSDAVKASLDIIESLEGDDMAGTAGYGNVGYGPGDKPSNLSWLTNDFANVRSQVSGLQAGMWTSNTNLAQGIDKGKAVLLSSPQQRKNAAKVMLLLTDGQPNYSRSGSSVSTSKAAADAKAAATDARGSNPSIQIFTISVGASADQQLMQDIAEIGGGEHFHAEGSVAQYKAQLDEIFQKLGGKRPVMLIE